MHKYADLSFSEVGQIGINPSGECFVVVHCRLTMPHQDESSWKEDIRSLGAESPTALLIDWNEHLRNRTGPIVMSHIQYN